MTRWTVTWEQIPEHHLAEVWVEASDRKAITDAVARIESLLSNSPLIVGDALSEGLYGITEPPVRVVYEVSEPDRLVKVTGIGIVN